MKPLHLAFFNRSFYPDTAATGQLLTELCETLVQRHGCRISVVAGVPLLSVGYTESAMRSQRLVERQEYRGMTILRARGTRFSKQRFRGRFSNYVSYFLSACYAGLKLERPDVVVALTDPPIIGLAAYLAARRFQVPLVMSYQDIFPEAARLLEDFHSEPVNRALQAINCFLVRKAECSIALGETMRKRLIEGKGALPERVIVIPGWADCQEIVPVPKDNAFARTHDLAEKFVVMHSGNLGLSQGLEVLVEAAARLQAFPEIVVVFVGEGVKKAALEEQARTLGLRNVRFLPYTPKDRLTESFASADVFIVSLKKGLSGIIVPSKIYGILAAGRPYVAAVEEDCEVTAITRRYDCGLLAALGDPVDLAEKIVTLYRDRTMVVRLGHNARLAGLQFDRAPQVEKYFALFQQLAAAQ